MRRIENESPLRLLRDCDHLAENTVARIESAAEQRYQAALLATTTSLMQALHTGLDEPRRRGRHLRAAERSLRDAVMAHIELGG